MILASLRQKQGITPVSSIGDLKFIVKGDFTNFLLFKKVNYVFFQFARIDAQKEEEARKRQMPLEINEWGEAGRNNNGNRNTAHEVLDNNQEIKTDNMEVVEDKQTA